MSASIFPNPFEPFMVGFGCSQRRRRPFDFIITQTHSDIQKCRASVSCAEKAKKKKLKMSHQLPNIKSLSRSNNLSEVAAGASSTLGSHQKSITTPNRYHHACGTAPAEKITLWLHRNRVCARAREVHCSRDSTGEGICSSVASCTAPSRTSVGVLGCVSSRARPTHSPLRRVLKIKGARMNSCRRRRERSAQTASLEVAKPKESSRYQEVHPEALGNLKKKYILLPVLSGLVCPWIPQGRTFLFWLHLEEETQKFSSDIKDNLTQTLCYNHNTL